MRKLPRVLMTGAGLVLAARHLPRIAIKASGIAVSLAKAGYETLADRGTKVLGREAEGDSADAVVARLVEPSAPLPTGEPEPAPEDVVAHEDLPLPDYDHLTLGSLRARMRKLSAKELEQLRDYERAHANRASVVVMFENRLRTLAEGEATAPVDA